MIVISLSFLTTSKVAAFALLFKKIELETVLVAELLEK